MRAMMLAALSLLAGLAPSQTRPEPSPAADRARLEPLAQAWLKENLVPFQSDVLSRPELKAFVDMVGEARVIGLGEPTHGDQQSHAFKTQVVRELVRQGKVSMLVLEMNRAAGDRVNKYVHGEGELTEVILRGGIFQNWRTDEFANLIAWLRAYVQQSGKEFRVIGVDCQDPAEDLGVVFNFLDQADPAAANKARSDFASLLESDRKGESLVAWTKSRAKSDFELFVGLAKALEELFDRHESEWQSRPSFKEARYAARTARQAFISYEYEFGPEPLDFTKIPVEYWGRRDRFMGGNLIEQLGDENAVLWAHDGHVQSWLPEQLVQNGYTTVGVEVRQALKEAYISVGFAWTRGVIHAKLVEDANNIAAAQRRPFEEFPLACDHPGDLGEFLARLETPRFFLDGRKANADTQAWGKLPYYRGSLGWAIFPDQWQLNPNQDAMQTFPCHDILVYFRDLSPSTLWRIPPRPTSG